MKIWITELINDIGEAPTFSYPCISREIAEEFRLHLIGNGFRPWRVVVREVTVYERLEDEFGVEAIRRSKDRLSLPGKELE